MQWEENSASHSQYTCIQDLWFRLTVQKPETLTLNHCGCVVRGQALFEGAVAEATEREQANPLEPLPFTVTVLVIGPVGVGKSDTINSLLGQPIAETNAFENGTTKVPISSTILWCQ